jgi:multiple sugar transport system ATP-binding protein
MAPVTINKAGKHYGGFEALKGVSVDISDGEFLVLVGPSGCGKSTALKMIAGLEEISGGEVKIADEVVNDFAARDRDIAMIFQSYALYPHMSVFDNIAFPLQINHVPKAEIAERVKQVAKTLQLEDYLARRPGKLSGGQRQRVAMGRAIIRQPAVFLMDEPLSNLDAKLRVQMRSEIAQIQKRLNVTTIYVTHDQVEAMTMGDRVALLNEGVLQQVDTPNNIYNRPNNTFVASFIGSPSMNFINGAAADGGFKTTDGIQLPAVNVPANAAVYGIRPEHLHLDPNGIEIEVVVLEPTGSETQVIGRLGTQSINGIFRERITAQPGSKIKVAPDLSVVHLFDKDGKRVN